MSAGLREGESSLMPKVRMLVDVELLSPINWVRAGVDARLETV